jgi:transcription initiation factor TFIIIB Brf1 subunit/transcription initiation factor TFIIB
VGGETMNCPRCTAKMVIRLFDCVCDYCGWRVFNPQIDIDSIYKKIDDPAQKKRIANEYKNAPKITMIFDGVEWRPGDNQGGK